MRSKPPSPSTGLTAGIAQPMEPGFTFPQALVYPQLSHVSQAERDVGHSIDELNTRAQHLGESFGIPFTTYSLNPPALPSSNDGWAVAGAILVALAHREERVSLERRAGKWGLYFTREPAVLAPDKRSEAVLLRDAPLDVRERFLAKSEEFFRQYLALCKDRLGRMKESVVKGNQTLRLIDDMRLV